jgi:hypothetical protein
MEIKELKEDLGMLIISDLEDLGLSSDDIESSDKVQLYTTTDDYCHEKRESTWIASINNSDRKFMMIANGILYDEVTAEKLSKKAEVARIFVDEAKAEMLIDALAHSYPELVYDRVDVHGDFPEEEEAEEEEENIDVRIGILKKEISRLKKLKDKKSKCSSDGCIDAYKKIKIFAGKYKEEKVEPAIIKRKNTILFISAFKDQKVVKLVEANVGNIASQKIGNLPSREITKTVIVDKKLASSLLKKIDELR